ncbi:VOC family protein [Amycolatopsis sp. CA-230715]|uniref:VOC family protein n=1 Tax=Amycolatopsis sp. CA-230715 TaxID=2745196 RepID=UPI001C02F168|nr:VOC family protein [Amycolatopsis sp. CA-230715]QWF80650.1 hypothetical protein HUW46_04073 [Amycolatopsis sp. CA-230715]
MTATVLAIAIDCHDAEALAGFWCGALGQKISNRFDDAEGVTYVETSGDPVLVFQPVPEGKSVKNRLHLDLAPTDGGQYDEVDRLVSLGAKVIEDEPAFPWVVLTDPEGNEFCVLPPR